MVVMFPDLLSQFGKCPATGQAVLLVSLLPAVALRHFIMLQWKRIEVHCNRACSLFLRMSHPFLQERNVFAWQKGWVQLAGDGQVALPQGTGEVRALWNIRAFLPEVEGCAAGFVPPPPFTRSSVGAF